MPFEPIRGYKNPKGFPRSEHQLRRWERNRDTNGMGAAFVKVQGRVLFDPEVLQQLIAEQAKASEAARK